ncbi:hypothetical protein V5799_030631 [Amblyomma americanum]|uniref:Uncharacterized protein n=1 Tax=Amblyomma americanum TaxID=6943 RepID=A0AAQ4EMI8_AMBAM
MGAGCRKRMACEAARTMTHVFPLSDYWQETVRLGPEPNSAYFAAWYKGLLNKDCSEFYPDCSNSPTGMVLPLLTDVLGPKGFVGSFLERLAIPSSPQVPRDAGAPRTSLVMERLREAQRRWESKEARISSEEIASRRA